jgi:hypothetical protein
MAQQRLYPINLQWQTFSVSLPIIDANLCAQYPSYKGNQSHSQLELFFTSDVDAVPQGGQSIRSAINVWWNAMNSSSPEASAYQSKAQLKVASIAAKTSAIAKLKDLGLTDAEIAALKS